MNDEKTEKRANNVPVPVPARQHQLEPRPASKNLQRLIFQSPHPEQVIRTFPAQSLFMAVKQAGLLSSSELVLAASLEQCRVMLDLDIWDRDRFLEENFWEWLRLPDAEEDLRILQKLLKFTDLKLVALLIARHTDVVINEEPTEAPPAPGFFTPDKGHSWINITTEDADQQFLLGRLLALLFETDADLYYQLLAIPASVTEAVLEEESFQDRMRRLGAEGIPDDERAGELSSGISREEAQAVLAREEPAPIIQDIPAVGPFLHDTFTVQPLASVLAQIGPSEELERELTLIANAGIVRWKIPFHDYEAVTDFLRSVKGAMNIGLGVASNISDRSPADIARILGWQRLYRLGLRELEELRGIARQARELDEEGDFAAAAVVELARRPFPMMPNFFRPDGSFQEGEDGKLDPSERPIEHLQEVEALKKFFERL